jgi:uncharacterized protein
MGAMNIEHTTPTLVPGRTCGDCGMCCKLPQIDALNKPANQWCVHCSTRKSCDAYDARPEQCRTFFCHFMENAALGEEWRPSKSRFMLMGKDNGQTVLVVVDPDRPDAWKRHPYFQQLGLWSRTHRVIINVGDKQMVLHGDHLHAMGESLDH